MITLLTGVPTLATRMRMGVMKDCDNGDWKWMEDVNAEGGLEFNTQCAQVEATIFNKANASQLAISWCDSKKENLKPGLHKCMDISIYYKEKTIPVSGTHRPVWPVYGEYSYLPPQRWIHNLEHGAVVFLFHPCAPAATIAHLRRLVNGCLRRHIITPSRRLSAQRPFALVSWGCFLNFATFEDADITSWIQRQAVKKRGVDHAPEYSVWADGDYQHLLIQKAATVTDNQDSKICPASF